MTLHDTTSVAHRPDIQEPAAICHALQGLLEVASQDLDTQIREYPTPIPRCDAQFNHVYELRACALRELARLRAALADQTPERALRIGAEDMLAHAPYTDGEDERRLRHTLQDWK